MADETLGRIQLPYSLDDTVLDATALAVGEAVVDQLGRLRLGNGVTPGGIVPSGPALSVKTFGARGTDTGDDGPAIGDALFSPAVLSGAVTLVFPKGKYRTSIDFRITAPNVQMHFEEGAEIIQTTHGLGFLQIVGNGTRITGTLKVSYVGTRIPISGNFYGFSALQRMSAVWLEGSDTWIERVSVKNMMVGVCLRGPVVRRDSTPPAPSDSQTVIDFTPQATGNFIGHIMIDGCDLGLTGSHQKDGAVYSGFSKNITKQQGIPPHDIYMRTNAEGTVYQGTCTRFNIGFWHAVDNLFSQPFKIRNITNSTIGVLTADNCAGGYLGTYTTDCTVYLGSLTNLREQNAGTEDPEDDGTSFVAELNYSARVDVFGCNATAAEGARVGAARSRNACFRVRFFNISLTESQTGVDISAVTPYRTQDTAFAEFINCARFKTGGTLDKDMFVAADSSSMVVRGARQQGSVKFANCAASAKMYLEFSSILVEGYTTPASLAGTVSRMTVNDTSSAEIDFTPTLLSSTSTQPAAYTTQAGKCFRKGSLVTVTIRLTLSGAHGLPGSTLDIGGLPFAPRQTPAPARWFGKVASDNVTMTAGHELMASMNTSGQPLARLQNWVDTSGDRGNTDPAQLGSDTRLDLTLVYETTAPWGITL